MADNFGLKIGLEGEKEFKKSISEINQTFKVLGSEMKLVTAQFDKNDNSIEALTARQQVLGKEVDAQRQKVETLRAALANATESFGENDRRTQQWQIQLNNAEAALDKAGREMDDTGDQADDMGDEVDEAADEADDAGKSFESLGTICKATAATMAAAFAAVSAAAIAAGKALVDMAVEGAAYADTVLTEATVTGIATDKLQEYMYAAELVDVSTETLTKSMAKQMLPCTTRHTVTICPFATGQPNTLRLAHEHGRQEQQIGRLRCRRQSVQIFWRPWLPSSLFPQHSSW